MDKTPDPGQEPAQLRFLRLLVTVLTGVMILGLLTIIGLLVMRFRTDMAPAPEPALPAAIALPDGTRPKAVTLGTDWVAVVTETDDILVFDRDGALIQQIQIVPSQPSP